MWNIISPLLQYSPSIIVLLILSLRFVVPKWFDKQVGLLFDKRLKKYEQELAQETERLKATLKEEGDSKLAEFAGLIQRQNKWDEIRLANLRTEQGDIFRDIYQKLVALFDSATDLTVVLGEDKAAKLEKLSAYKEAAQAFSQAYETQKIWLNVDLCKLIDSFCVEMNAALKDLEAYLHSEYDPGDRTFKATQAAWNGLVNNVGKKKEEIEALFRGLLHV
jgi:hypothetical protein